MEFVGILKYTSYDWFYVQSFSVSLLLIFQVVDDGVPSYSEEIVDLNDDPMNIEALMDETLTWLQTQPPVDSLLL